jgi:hypothetical protein
VARIRSIKPEFWTSEQVMSCSVAARLLFIGLWNFCDDCGHHPLAPNQIKALIFPCDSLITQEAVQEMIDELSVNGLVTIYAVEGRKYLEVTGWRHQKIDKPQKPKFPQPIAEHSTNPPRTLATERNTEYIIDGSATEPDKDEIRERGALSLNVDDAGMKAKKVSVVVVEPAPTSIVRRNASIDPNYRPPEHLVEVCRTDGATDAVIEHELRMFIATKQEQSALSDNWDASWVKWWGRWKERKAKDAPKASVRTEVNGPADWDSACITWTKFGRWPRSGMGGEPGMLSCRCPPEILRKHGVDPSTGVKTRQAIESKFDVRIQERSLHRT